MAFDPADYEVEQVFYPSKDGTQDPHVPRAQEGPEARRQNPTLLYGYGGFNIAADARRSPWPACVWLEMGGVYAMANLRGGGEYGKDWHERGPKLTRSRMSSTTSSPPPSG